MIVSHRIRSLVLVISGAIAAPLEAQRAPLPSRHFAADSFWVTEWTRGFRKEEDLLIEPRGLVVSGNVLAVLDLGTRQVLMFAGDNGRLTRTLEARGEGPGEFRRPSMLMKIDGGVAVLDQATRRITAFSLDGRPLWDLPAPSLAAVGCANSATQLTFKVDGVRNAIVTVDTSGRRVATRSLSWPSTGREHMSTSAVAAGPTTSGACVFARQFGSTFVVVERGGTQRSYSYIESVPEPKVTVSEKVLERSGRKAVVQVVEHVDGTSAAMDAAVIGDTLVVHFAGTTPDKYRLLDYYDTRSGVYLFSRRLRSIGNVVAVGTDGRIYLSVISDEAAGIAALRPSLTPPRQSNRKQ